MAKITANENGAIWWANLQLMQVVFCCCLIVAMFSQSFHKKILCMVNRASQHHFRHILFENVLFFCVMKSRSLIPSNAGHGRGYSECDEKGLLTNAWVWLVSYPTGCTRVWSSYEVGIIVGSKTGCGCRYNADMCFSFTLTCLEVKEIWQELL